MATFTTIIGANNFGSNASRSGDIYSASGNAIVVQFADHYETYYGSYGYYANGTPYGQVTQISAFTYGNNQEVQRWTADGATYSAQDFYNLGQFNTSRDFFAYIFYLDDDIYGSPVNDWLNGYTGNDYINAGQGNDKLKGGPGFDVFFFQAFDGRDIIQDFKRKQDSIWLDDSLASDYGDVRAAARPYNNGVILDFGSDEIKIADLTVRQLKKVDFDFV